MKRHIRPLCIIFVLLIFSVILLEEMPASFFSDLWETENSAETGSVEVFVDNLSLNDRNLFLSSEETVSGILNINSSAVFSFSVTNRGRSAAEFFLSMSIVWSSELEEGGNLFIFPPDMSNEEILYNLQNNIYDECIAGEDDAAEDGINKALDDGILSGGSARNYSYKLFFYADEEIVSAPEKIRGESVEIALTADADVPDRATAWAKTDKRSFSLTASDFSVPLIKENPLPKTFFITQGGSIDLYDYAEAEDEIDGDITPDIVVSCPSGFSPYEAGVYEIVYTVRNSSGIPAIPLVITVTIWNFIKIESGTYHSLALTSHGQVYSWGNNYYGQLGNGKNSSALPALIEGLSGITDIAAGGESSYALDAEGQLYAWGNNNCGQLGLGNTSAFNRPQAVAAPDGVRFTDICAQIEVAGAVTAEGEAYTWGYGGHGALGKGTESNRLTPKKLDLAGVKRLELNRLSGAAVTAEGALYTWGYNSNGMLGLGSSSSSILLPSRVNYFTSRNITVDRMSLGWYHMTAVSTDGRLFTWGLGAEGRLGSGGTGDSNLPVHIPLHAAAVMTRADYGHTAVLVADGTAYLFGQNSYGKLGDGSEQNRTSPVLLAGVEDITYLSLGAESSFALTAAGEVFGMGYGNGYALGNTTNGSTTPVKWNFTPPPPRAY